MVSSSQLAQMSLQGGIQREESNGRNPTGGNQKNPYYSWQSTCDLYYRLWRYETRYARLRGIPQHSQSRELPR